MLFCPLFGSPCFSVFLSAAAAVASAVLSRTCRLPRVIVFSVVIFRLAAVVDGWTRSALNQPPPAPTLPYPPGPRPEGCRLYAIQPSKVYPAVSGKALIAPTVFFFIRCWCPPSQVLEMGYEEDHTLNNAKLSVMALACVFAVTAQFWPQPFPESRLLLAVCCAR